MFQFGQERVLLDRIFKVMLVMLIMFSVGVQLLPPFVSASVGSDGVRKISRYLRAVLRGGFDLLRLNLGYQGKSGSKLIKVEQRQTYTCFKLHVRVRMMAASHFL